MPNANDDIYLLVLLGMAGTLLLCGAIIFFYIRYQKKFYSQRTQIQQAELDYQVSLLHATIQSQEKERKRIGRDLHDDVGAALANMRLAISNLARQESLTTIKNDVVHCRQLTDDIIETVRNISHTLSPSGLELFGLADSIEELCEHRSKHSTLSISFDNRVQPSLKDLSPDVAIALYRVVQELLTNTFKHAEAGKVTIVLYSEADKLLLNYADDGKGIDMQQQNKTKGIGMHNIETRLNMIQALYETGTEGKGFSIHISVPGAFATH